MRTVRLPALEALEIRPPRNSHPRRCCLRRRMQSDPFVKPDCRGRKPGGCEIAPELEAVFEIGWLSAEIGDVACRSATAVLSWFWSQMPSTRVLASRRILRKCAAANGQPSSSMPIKSDPGRILASS